MTKARERDDSATRLDCLGHHQYRERSSLKVAAARDAAVLAGGLAAAATNSKHPKAAAPVAVAAAGPQGVAASLDHFQRQDHQEPELLTMPLGFVRVQDTLPSCRSFVP